MPDYAHITETQALMLLQRVSGIGPKRLRQLVEHFLSASNVWQVDASQWNFLPSAIKTAMREIQRQGTSHASFQQVLSDQDSMAQAQIHVLTLNDDLYPPLLKETDNAPALLYVKGDPSYLSQPQIAVVGSRKASQQTLQLTHRWASELSQAGLIITSGLALGVDGAAHQGAIDIHRPTIAVLAHGMDSLYPQRHNAMAAAIEGCGALVTEFPLGVPAKREHFPRRNRIISGLSLGLLVTQAALKSGSMITAQYAIEQNRDVFAVPGNVHDTQVAGCHALIQQGAYLASCSADILQGLNWQVGDISAAQFHDSTQAGSGLNPQQQALLAQIPFQPIHIDELIQTMACSPALLAGQLLELEILNIVECIGGNYQRIQ